jgi:hypothetical protein
MIRQISFAALIICLLAAPASAFISVSSITRTVAVDITGGFPLDYTTTSIGPYNAMMNSSGPSPYGVCFNEASQSSQFPSFGFGGIGNGSITVTAAPNGTGTFSVNSQSSLIAEFTVTGTQNYNLNASVDWVKNTNSAPFGGWTRVVVQDVTNATVPFYVQRDSMLPGAASLNLGFPLVSGTNYNFWAENYVFGGGNQAGEFDVSANWNFFLSPEPTTATLFAFGLLISCGITRRPART